MKIKEIEPDAEIRIGAFDSLKIPDLEGLFAKLCLIDEVHVDLRKSNKLMEQIIPFDAIPPPKSMAVCEREWYDKLPLEEGKIY